LKQEPKRAIAYRNLANAEAMMGAPSKAQDGKAIDCYKKASRLQPDSTVIAVKLLTGLSRQNKLDELAHHVGIVEDLAPDHPAVKFFKAVICFRRKDLASAKELLRTRYLGLACDNLHLEAEAIDHVTRAKSTVPPKPGTACVLFKDLCDAGILFQIGCAQELGGPVPS